MPPPSALPSRYTSGTTPSRSHANVVADAAETRLDLVGDEQHVVPRADLAHRAEVALGRDDDAGLALDRLDEHGGGLRA